RPALARNETIGHSDWKDSAVSAFQSRSAAIGRVSPLYKSLWTTGHAVDVPGGGIDRDSICCGARAQKCVRGSGEQHHDLRDLFCAATAWSCVWQYRQHLALAGRVVPEPGLCGGGPVDGGAGAINVAWHQRHLKDANLCLLLETV